MITARLGPLRTHTKTDLWVTLTKNNLFLDIPRGVLHIFSVRRLRMVTKDLYDTAYTCLIVVVICRICFTTVVVVTTPKISTPALTRPLEGLTTLSTEIPLAIIIKTLLRAHLGLPVKMYLLTNLRPRPRYLRPRIMLILRMTL